MSNFLIRRGKSIDSEKVYSLDSTEKDSYSLDTINSMLSADNSLTLVVEDVDKVIGYINFSIAIDEAELIKIVVDSNYRRCGIAKSLIDRAVETLKEQGIKIIFLEVRVDNVPAKNLYEKSGFIKYFTREKYYNGIDADLYRLKLNDK